MAQTRQKKAVKQKIIAIIALVLLIVLAVGLLCYQTLLRAYYPIAYQPEVERWAAEYEVDPYLVYAVIRTESSFKPQAESSAGARGLMQMTEDTFDWVKSHIAEDEPLLFEDLYQPDTAIRFGTYLLSISLDRYADDIPTAAAAYHSGWGTVDRLLEAEVDRERAFLTEFPFAQMRHYVNKVNRAYSSYTNIYA